MFILFEDLKYLTVNSKYILIFNNLILLLRIYKFDICDFNVQIFAVQTKDLYMQICIYVYVYKYAYV